MLFRGSTRASIVALMGSLAFAGTAVAQPQPAAPAGYPSKLVRFILPFPPGGGTDILGRVLSQKLSNAVGQPVVPENRPGAGGNVGQELAAKAQPDGYTIVLCSPSIAISPSLYKKLSYDPLKDLVPIALVANIPNLLAVHSSVPARSLKELVALAKSRPGKLTFGTGGAGTANELGAHLFTTMNKADLLIVPHKGVNQAMIALLGGHVDMVLVGVANSKPHVQAGKLRALAVLGPKRAAAMPDVPTAAQSGMPWFDVQTWYGTLAPAGTPQNIIRYLNAEFVKIVNAPDVRQQLEGMGAEPLSSTPEEFAEFIKLEARRWARVVRDSGAQVE